MAEQTFRTKCIQKIHESLTRPRTEKESAEQVEALLAVSATCYLATHHLSPDWIADLTSVLMSACDEWQRNMTPENGN